jgi:hypothetical protein
MADCAVGAESFTWTLNGNVPAAVGVPVIAPVEAFRARPVGSDPEAMLHAYGFVPPVAESAALYATWTWSPTRLVVLICKGTTALVVVIESAWVADCGVDAESLTLTLNGNVPEAEGVPVIAPVEAFRLRPPGSDPEAMLQTYGSVPPAAVRVEP